MLLPPWFGDDRMSYTRSLDAKGLHDELFQSLMDALQTVHDLGRLIESQHPTLDGRDIPLSTPR